MPDRGVIASLHRACKNIVTGAGPAQSLGWSKPMSDEFIAPGRFIDSGAPNIVAFANGAADGDVGALARVLRLYRAVRDDVVYDPCCRVIGVPARVGYADVRNHLSSPRLSEYMGTDIYVWHSYADILIDGKWVKATPAFNSELCRRLGLAPLEFDGRTDSLLHPYDRAGRLYMEYRGKRDQPGKRPGGSGAPGSRGRSELIGLH